MTYTYTSRFSRSYLDLGGDLQKQIDDAIRLFASHPHHPFPKRLRVHKLNGVRGTPQREGDPAPDIWEMHAKGGSVLLVITMQFWPDEVVFRNCGKHEDVLRNP